MKTFQWIAIWIGLMLFSSAAAAQETAERILLEPSFIGAHESYDLDKKELRNLLVNKIIRAKHMKDTFITYGELEAEIANFSQRDMKQIKKDNPTLYSELMDRYLPQYVDGILEVQISYENKDELERLGPGKIPIADSQGELSYDVRTYDHKATLSEGEPDAVNEKKAEGTLLYRNEVRQELVYNPATGAYQVKTQIVQIPVERYQAIFESKEITKAVSISWFYKSLDGNKEWQYHDQREIEKLGQTPLITVGDLLDRATREWQKSFGKGIDRGVDPGTYFTGDDIDYLGVKKS